MRVEACKWAIGIYEETGFAKQGSNNSWLIGSQSYTLLPH